jgi:hypothetical protein
MQRFIVSVLCASVFFTGLGFLVEKTNASFKSDEKALDLLRRARVAIGGDSAIGGVKSMTITGKMTKTFEVEGAARSENGEMEINFELPNKMSRKIKLGSGDGNELIDKQVDVVVMRKEADGDNLQFKTESGDGSGTRQFRIMKKDGTTEDVKIDGKTPFVLRKTDDNVIVSEDGKTADVDGKKVVVRRADALVSGDKMRSNELFRTTLALLLSAPEGTDVSYTYAGEGAVDGVMCDIIAANDGGSTIKLYLDKSSSLPRMISYQAPKPFMIFMRKDDKTPPTDGETRTFVRRLETPEAPEMAEFQIKFSDFRAVNGLQLPFKWTQTVNGKTDETIDISAYEINPANIAEKLKEVPTRTFVRVQKDQ